MAGVVLIASSIFLPSHSRRIFCAVPLVGLLALFWGAYNFQTEWTGPGGDRGMVEKLIFITGPIVVGFWNLVRIAVVPEQNRIGHNP